MPCSSTSSSKTKRRTMDVKVTRAAVAMTVCHFNLRDAYHREALVATKISPQCEQSLRWNNNKGSLHFEQITNLSTYAQTSACLWALEQYFWNQISTISQGECNFILLGSKGARSTGCTYKKESFALIQFANSYAANIYSRQPHYGKIHLYCQKHVFSRIIIKFWILMVKLQ